MDKRFKAIITVLAEYAVGNFKHTLPISSKYDEMDGIMNVINMVGEELNATRISKDYFNQIFNAVSDMVFILNAKGNIIDLNAAVDLQLGYGRKQLLGKTMRYLHASDKPFSAAWLKQVKSSQDVSYLDSFLRTADGRDIPVHVVVSPLSEPPQGITGIMITAQDNSQRLQDENDVTI